MSHKILQGDWIAVLKTLQSESVHCVVTSPPYWGLRDYGAPGQLGLEPTPEEYVRKLVEGFREVRRVLRNDGTLWLNLGDSYCGASSEHKDVGSFGKNSCISKKTQTGVPMNGRGERTSGMRNVGLKPKDLVGIPWRVAFALQADGWWLRSDIIWHKPNPMPESVTDRPTKAHEYLFLLSKSERYYYDAEAIKETANGWNGSSFTSDQDIATKPNLGRGERSETGFRNKRSVWTIATQPFPEAHFATFPEDLVKPCILAGTSEKGVCAKCGAPWERILEPDEQRKSQLGSGWHDHADDLGHGQINGKPALGGYVTTGWQPTCSCCSCDVVGGCECKEPLPYPTKRSVVLDPFAGSGTVGLVARLNHCDFIGIELNPEYCWMAERRLGQEVLAF